jgi:hypothetical protein
MSEQQLTHIIVLLCLGFVWDAMKLIFVVSNEYEYRDIMTARLSRLEDFLAQRTCPRCECGCEEEEEEEEEQEEDQEEEEEEDQEEAESVIDEEEDEEERTTIDGAAYKFTVNLNAEMGTREVLLVDEESTNEVEESAEEKKDQ